MIGVVLFAASMVALSLLGLIWDVASGLLASGMDGILLLLICLLVGGIFSLQLLLIVRKNGRLAQLLLPNNQGREPSPSSSGAKGGGK